MPHSDLTPFASILHWFSLASEEDKLSGLTWYSEANLFAQYLASQYHGVHPFSKPLTLRQYAQQKTG